MKRSSPLGTGTLLPFTSARKQKIAQSLRASRQPVDRVSHVRQRPSPARPPRPIPPPPAIPAECREPEPQTFTLELIRPAVGLPDLGGGKRVSMHQTFEPRPSGEIPEHVLTVRLELGEPYELRLDGLLAYSENGDGWQDRARSVLTIRATASAGPVGSFTPIGVHQPVAGRNVHPILIVPVSALHAVYMELDGRELVNLPAPQ